MKTFSNTTSFKIKEPCIVTIGKFDGEHAGHKKIFSVMREEASKRGLKLAVFTFVNPPSFIVENLGGNLQITTNEERRKKFIEEGVDYLVEYPFTKETSRLEAMTFVKDILISKMNMKAIVAGIDCAFGYNKSGNIALLNQMKKEYDFEVVVVEKVKYKNDLEISSSLIRDLISEGEIKDANRLLESVYSITGTVVVGNKLGRELGFPTVNIYPPIEKITPKYGVYATKVEIKSEGKIYYGISNIGTNPSVKTDSKNHRERVETWIFGFDKEIYGKEIEVFFYEYIREQKTFESLEKLKEQIKIDKEKVAKFWKIPCTDK